MEEGYSTKIIRVLLSLFSGKFKPMIITNYFTNEEDCWKACGKNLAEPIVRVYKDEENNCSPVIAKNLTCMTMSENSCRANPSIQG